MSVDLTISQTEVDEDSGSTVTITASRSSDSNRAITGTISVSGTASLGGDFLLSDTEIELPASTMSDSVTVTPLRDWFDEGTETASFSLSGPSIRSQQSVSLSILDGADTPPDKSQRTPDLITLAYLSVSNDRILVDTNIWNVGGSSSSATESALAFATVPDFSELVIRRQHSIPPIEPFRSYSYSESVHTRVLSADTDYYGVVQVSPAGNEFSRGNNTDILGFSLDGRKHVIARCNAPSRPTPAGTDDPLLDHQWQIDNTGQSPFGASAGVPGADMSMTATMGEDIGGRNVRVAVVDTGLELCHPDLADSIEPNASYNFLPSTNIDVLDPFNTSTLGDHGTSVAGIVGAVANNGRGIRGISPYALLRGYNYLNAQSQTSYVSSLGGSTSNPNSSDVDIFNMSFGSILPSGVNEANYEMFRDRVQTLRNRRGAIFVTSGGNSFRLCYSMRADLHGEIGCRDSTIGATQNTPFVIAVGSYAANDMRASYSAAGSNLWVVGPGGEASSGLLGTLTTDQFGRHKGYGVLSARGIADESYRAINPDLDYMSSFSGTSSAAPHVSGAVAILLEVQPDLTWRDVKYILAKTARRLHADISEITYGLVDAPHTFRLPWIENDAGYWFHNWYGFGAVDVDRAVALARTHSPDGLGQHQISNWFQSSRRATIPDGMGSGVTQELDVPLSAGANIEAVEFRATLSHGFGTDLAVHLTSPSGTKSILNTALNTAYTFRVESSSEWHSLSNAFYGESPNGTWTLNIVDVLDGDTGELSSWRLRFHYGNHP